MDTLLTDQMLPLAAGAIAFVLMLVVTPLVISIARKLDWVDYPRPGRWHRRPTALMGGIAIFAAAAAALVITRLAVPWWIWCGATIMFVTGLVDDRRDVSAMAKLVPQLVAAALPLFAGVAFAGAWPEWLAVPLTILWVIGITNAVNLIDGMDGLASGVTAIAAYVMMAIAWRSGDVETAALAAVLATSAAGFLVFNFHPARIFMGDGGSLFLGFMLAAVALQLQAGAGAADQLMLSLIPIVVLAVPIFDTTLVTLDRLLHSRWITDSGTDHTMHRLVRLGLPERRTVLLLYAFSGLLGLLAVALHETDAGTLFGLLAFVLIGMAVFGAYLRSVDVYDVGGDGAADASPSLSTRLCVVLRSVFGRDWKGVFGVGADIMVVTAGFMLAHHLRFEAELTAFHKEMIVRALPILLLVKIPIFYTAGLYRGIWRYAGTPEIILLVKAGVVASAVAIAALGAVYGFGAYSTAVLVVDAVIVTGGIAGVRLGFRALRQYILSNKESGRRTLLYGAGRAGSVALREIRTDPRANARPVGFLDDDPLKQGLSLQGIEVLGGLDELSEICERLEVEELLICGATIGQARRNRAQALCRIAGIRCRLFDVTIRDLSETSEANRVNVTPTDLLDEELIALTQQAPELMTAEARAHVRHLLARSDPARLLSEFYRDFYEELVAAQDEPHAGLVPFVEDLTKEKA